MSGYLDTLLGLGAAAANAAQPHVVISAPDGAQLWIPVTIPTGGDSSDETSLWPRGFKIGLRIGAPPTAANITTSPTRFIGSHSLDLLRAWWVAPPPNAPTPPA